MLIRKEPLL